MSNIKDEAGGLKASDIEYINGKRIVIIVDEAHRSTFGDMLITRKTTFAKAIFFGFTGTPIHDENQKKTNTTTLSLIHISDGKEPPVEKGIASISLMVQENKLCSCCLLYTSRCV